MLKSVQWAGTGQARLGNVKPLPNWFFFEWQQFLANIANELTKNVTGTLRLLNIKKEPEMILTTGKALLFVAVCVCLITISALVSTVRTLLLV